ncbi:hypothetical protein CK203_023063 [Vitis vinifera]|uniref:Retrotransposon gag domain-containing protein n=1 Tax=Vitis vinifera TaxID=29760 RepID=A0A438J435_VITVI|nr:hypothetical protein CK203_023063 [Vitis vinifera]
MKQGDREVTEYYTEMLGLWQELDLVAKKSGSARGTACRFKKKMENERVFEFLAGLNASLMTLGVGSQSPAVALHPRSLL